MEFGRVTPEELDTINFTLPEEPAFNKNILPGKKSNDPKIYVGCAKWGRKEWVNKIYPKGTPEKDFLKLYVENFNCIELNATGYKTPTSEQAKAWADKAKGKDFLFCPKLVRFIIPNDNSATVKQNLQEFIESSKGFGKHLGPFFLLLMENYAPSKAKALFNFLHDFPKDNELFVELRNQEWYSNKNNLEQILKEFSIQNTGLIITDTAGRRDMTHMYLTVPKAFIRFVGNSLHTSDYIRLDDWVNRIKYWLDKGLKELYFFIHMHDEAQSPEIAVYIIEQLNKKCKLNILIPKWQNGDNNNLFKQ